MNWKVGTLKSNTLGDCLAVFTNNSDENFNACVCVVSPLDAVTEEDEKNAQLISLAPALKNILNDLLPYIIDLEFNNIDDIHAGKTEDKKLTEIYEQTKYLLDSLT
jgi:hypothetical protein